MDDGIIPWVTDMVTANGGATFLIVSSIIIMAAATRRIVGLNGGMTRKNYYILWNICFLFNDQYEFNTN